jgi:hypothetical protein
VHPIATHVRHDPHARAPHHEPRALLCRHREHGNPWAHGACITPHNGDSRGPNVVHGIGEVMHAIRVCRSPDLERRSRVRDDQRIASRTRCTRSGMSCTAPVTVSHPIGVRDARHQQ